MVPEKIHIRVAIFGILALLVFSVLLGRLWFLQVLAGEKYAKLAEENRIRLVAVDAPRGTIYDRKGNILVENRPSPAISVDPSIVKDKRDVLSQLAEILGVSIQEIEEKLEEKRDPLKPVIVKKDVDEKTLSFIKEHQLEFPGVDIQIESIRDYPRGNLAAHILGYLGEISEEELKKKEYKHYSLGDFIGKTGVERQYESVLRGEKGGRQVEVDATGRPLRILGKKDPVPGYNLMLTIDADMQQAAEEALAAAIDTAHRHGHEDATAGAVVVMDPRNGEVLALASHPSYDPRLFKGGVSSEEWTLLNDPANHFPLNNRAIMCSYPPGSTFKPITAVAGMAENLVSPKSTFKCTGRWTRFGERWAKSCWKRSGHGGIDLIRGIIHSCDVVFYEIGYMLHKTQEKFQEWSRRFGFGTLTGIDLPSEAKGRVPDKAWKRERYKYNPQYRVWLPGDTVNMAIGQGDLLVTPLQMANAYAAIANSGTLYKPHVAKALLIPDGRVSYEFKPQELGKLELPPGIIGATQIALKRVVSQGTASGAFAGFPVPVAGKTGTAQVFGKDDFAWFACYAPADNPQYVVVVLVEQGGHGGSTAAPAARRILSHIFNVPLPEPVDVIDVSR